MPRPKTSFKNQLLVVDSRIKWSSNLDNSTLVKHSTPNPIYPGTFMTKWQLMHFRWLNWTRENSSIMPLEKSFIRCLKFEAFTVYLSTTYYSHLSYLKVRLIVVSWKWRDFFTVYSKRDPEQNFLQKRYFLNPILTKTSASSSIDPEKKSTNTILSDLEVSSHNIPGNSFEEFGLKELHYNNTYS